MLTFFAGLGLKGILVVVLGIFVVVFILKKLFKLVLTIAVIIALVHFGLPFLQTAMSR
ncbi:hypothetical protein [Desulfosporosinus metallidurans]|uniref:Uncharacterized protein n=1 Tax=Desulfosporosinus metallidurans TaxID=1888891 RepID=A0A1Q8QP28_9FIRM|nr:hypothetical protein [Desulfosporosinus metallidurans]OLN29084.1 hypothetical protein DSOL_3745 [Desulfosporosinus metallidurans]